MLCQASTRSGAGPHQSDGLSADQQLELIGRAYRSVVPAIEIDADGVDRTRKDNADVLRQRSRVDIGDLSAVVVVGQL